jgi:hypothetical protein
MLAVAAFEVGNPVLFFVQMEADDPAEHLISAGRRSAVRRPKAW